MAMSHEVVILSYTNPGFPGFETQKRKAWLDMLYPQAQVFVIDDEWLAAHSSLSDDIPFRTLPYDSAADDDHRLFCAWLCETHIGGPVDAVFTSEDYGDGFAEVLTQRFRERSPNHPAVEHVSVDKDRTQVSVSGTMVRRDLYAHRYAMPPAVYSSLIQRIALLGGESTGKSTLAVALAERLKTRFVPEYGRELWQTRRGALTFADYLLIARTQINNEEREQLESNNYLICDTTPLTTKFYCQWQYQRIDSELQELSQRHYDVVFLCAADFAFVQDGSRRDVAFRTQQQKWYEEQLQLTGIPYQMLTGPVEERLQSAIAVLDNNA